MGGKGKGKKRGKDGGMPSKEALDADLDVYFGKAPDVKKAKLDNQLNDYFGSKDSAKETPTDATKGKDGLDKQLDGYFDKDKPEGKDAAPEAAAKETDEKDTKKA